MSNRAELDRRAVKISRSPLAKHSLSNKNLRDQREGCIRLFGRDAECSAATQRREDKKRQRKQTLYNSIHNIFQGTATRKDELNVFMLADEFEKADPEAPNAAVIDFEGMQLSDAQYGEPEFFRRDKK